VEAFPSNEAVRAMELSPDNFADVWARSGRTKHHAAVARCLRVVNNRANRINA